MAADLKQSLLTHLDTLERLGPAELVAERQRRLAAFGVYSEGKP
jgi:acetyl-CoA carboxylase alpha subunit